MKQQLKPIRPGLPRQHPLEEAGNGIGLAVCKKVVNLHGGDIWAESKVGEGTTIHFTLPQRGERVAAAA